MCLQSTSKVVINIKKNSQKCNNPKKKNNKIIIKVQNTNTVEQLRINLLKIQKKN